MDQGGDGNANTQVGAEEYIDFTQVKDIAAEVMRITKYGAHASIVFAASREAYAVGPQLLRPGGTMVSVGLPTSPDVVAGAPPILLAMKRISIVGSVTGTLKDVEEALDFTARGLVHPILTKGDLGDVDKFCKMLKEGSLPGRAVLKVAG